MNTELAGKRVRCIEMIDDPNPIQSGAMGTILFTDDAGIVHVAWDNGRSLSLIPDIDRWEIIGNKEQ